MRLELTTILAESPRVWVHLFLQLLFEKEELRRSLEPYLTAAARGVIPH